MTSDAIFPTPDVWRGRLLKAELDSLVDHCVHCPVRGMAPHPDKAKAIRA
jgi:hypothetical protein